MNKLHKRGRWIFRFRAYGFFIFISIFGSVYAVYFLRNFISKFEQLEIISSRPLLISIGIYVFFILFFSEVYARMAYNRWFYEFDEHGLRLERGIIWKRYTNIPYERIQNVDLHRGLMARILGFSVLIIQTAGFSATPHAEGKIPAIGKHEAEHIREHLMKHISRR